MWVGVGEKGGGRVKCESESVSWPGEDAQVCVCVHVCLSCSWSNPPSQLNPRRRVVESAAHHPGSPRLFPSSAPSPKPRTTSPMIPHVHRCLSLPTLGRTTRYRGCREVQACPLQPVRPTDALRRIAIFAEQPPACAIPATKY